MVNLQNPTGRNIYQFGPHFIFQKVHFKDTEFNFIFTPVTLKDLPQRFILIFTSEVFSKKIYHKENRHSEQTSRFFFPDVYTPPRSMDTKIFYPPPPRSMDPMDVYHYHA